MAHARKMLVVGVILLTFCIGEKMHAQCSLLQQTNATVSSSSPTVVAKIVGTLKNVKTRDGVTTATLVPEQWFSGSSYAVFADNQKAIILQTSVAAEACGQWKFLYAAKKKIVVSVSDGAGLQQGKVVIQPEDELFPWTGKTGDAAAFNEIMTGHKQLSPWEVFWKFSLGILMVGSLLGFAYRRFMGLPEKRNDPTI